jgi:hypothetical protein
MVIGADDSGEEGFTAIYVETLTLKGSTWFESNSATSYPGEGDYTISVGCSIPASRGNGQRPVCTYSQNGAYLVSQYCSDYSSYSEPSTEHYTYTYTSEDGTESTETVTETYNYQSLVPDMCTEGASALPEDIAVATQKLDWSDVDAITVVVTAGEEKLTATAGASPSNTGARFTGITGTAQPTGTGAARQGGSPTGPSGVPAAPEETGAAAPLRTFAPALAGLGVAMAALVL